MLKIIDGGAETNQGGVAAGEAHSPLDEIARKHSSDVSLAWASAGWICGLARRIDWPGTGSRRTVPRPPYLGFWKNLGA
jgi:hypothetical protein